MKKLIAYSVRRRFNLLDLVWLSLAADSISKGRVVLWLSIIIIGVIASEVLESFSKRMEDAA